MTTAKAVFTLFLMLSLGALCASAQQSLPAISLPSRGVTVNVVVDTKSGQPVTGLRQQDFTIFDNKTPRPITSFKVMSPAQEPVRVILFIDAVNVPYQMLAYVRDGTERYLKSNEGTLSLPTTVAVLTDSGAQIDRSFTTNGNALNDELKSQHIALREINRSSEWGGEERMEICLTAFRQLLTFASTLPGRKIILWISPGWPLISGPQIYLTAKQEDQIFDTLVSISSQMQQSNAVLYNINPVGVGESLERTDYFQAFLYGVAKPSQAQIGNLGLQVLAVHSGGLALESNSDVTGNIQRCVADAKSWYEITFDPLPSDKPNQYHQIEIKLDQPGMIAHSRDSYYADPQVIEPQR